MHSTVLLKRYWPLIYGSIFIEFVDPRQLMSNNIDIPIGQLAYVMLYAQVFFLFRVKLISEVAHDTVYCHILCLYGVHFRCVRIVASSRFLTAIH